MPKSDILKLPIGFLQLGLSKKFEQGSDAAIPDGNSWKLIAMEGFMNEFVESEPWFAVVLGNG